MTQTPPADREPDGSIWYPHHFWIGLAVMLAGWLAWGAEPWGAHVAILGLLIVADDLIEHYLGVPTPLDTAFKRALRNDRVRRLYARYVMRRYGHD